jgi:hypothetical protein
MSGPLCGCDEWCEKCLAERAEDCLKPRDCGCRMCAALYVRNPPFCNCPPQTCIGSLLAPRVEVPGEAGVSVMRCRLYARI